MIGSARQNSKICPTCRVCTVPAGEVGCRAGRLCAADEIKASTAQVRRGSSKK
jgi:hypothetical protein